MIRVFKGLNFTFLQRGNALIYIAMSRVGDDVSFLKKQLEYLHLELISVVTRQAMDTLQKNPSFDLMADLWHGLPVLRRAACSLNKSPSVFLNMFLPLRYDNEEIAL